MTIVRPLLFPCPDEEDYTPEHSIEAGGEVFLLAKLLP
jgi:hypothetical protein